jgi:hypothetical protein
MTLMDWKMGLLTMLRGQAAKSTAGLAFPAVTFGETAR